MAQNYSQKCDVCGRVCEDDPLAPLALRIQSSRVATFSNFFDGSVLPGWLHFLFATQMQAIDMCASCATEYVTIDPAVIEAIAQKEVAAGRVPNERYLEPMRAKSRKDFREKIDKVAKRFTK